MSLPELVVFSIKDTDQEVRYLSFTGPHRQLRFSIEEGIYSDTVPFTVEQAGSGLVHIRSCYENKYWVRASKFESWLVASSLEKVDDMSKEECTLFRPQFSAGNVFVSFVHAQSGFNVAMRPAADAHAYTLSVEPAAPTEFSFIRYSQFRSKKLPRYLMFLGDNGRYLSARSGSPFTVLHFEAQNTTDKAVGFEIVYTKSGDVRVKSMKFEGFWGPIPNSSGNVRTVVILPNPLPNDPNTLYEASISIPAAVSYHGISLRCHGVNLVCLYMPHNTALGLANVKPNDHEACFRPRPAVQQGTRRVNIESYRHPWVSKLDAFLTSRRVYNTTDVESEYLFDAPDIEMSSRTTFRNSVSHFSGPSAIFNGRIPYVVPSGELQFPDQATSIDSNWGHTRVTSEKKTHKETLIVPPNTRIGVGVYKKSYVYEIPFSYQQIDGLPFGGNVTQHLHEGTCRIQFDYDIELRILHAVPVSSEEDISQLGVELVPGSGIFEYECSDDQEEAKTDETDQGSDAQTDIAPHGAETDEPDQEADAPAAI